MCPSLCCVVQVGSRGKKIEPEVIVKFQRAPNSKPFVNIKLHYVYEPSYEAYSESGPGYGDNIESFPLKWSTLAPRMERLEFHEVKFDET